jgi:hypothetical protein
LIDKRDEIYFSSLFFVSDTCIPGIKYRYKRESLLTLRKTNQMNQEPKEGHINIELNEEIAEGVYSNLAIITHSSSEFVMDFVRIMPGVPKAKVKSRIVMTPEHAKRLMRALADNISKYESHFGVVREDDSMNNGIPFVFGGPKTEA